MPIRARLALAFAAVMAALLAATGAFLYERTEHALTETLDAGIGARLDDVAESVRDARLDLDEEDGGERGVHAGGVQVLDADGAIRYATGDAGPLVPDALLRQLGATATFFDAAPLRVGAERVGSQVIAVAASAEERHETLDSLRTQLLLGGPIALVIASLAGYLLASAALRPVEAMRRTAAAIAPGQGARLPVPSVRDEIGRLGETLNAMLARGDSAFARERAFVADASHELRTPVSLLKGEIDLALERPRSAEEYERTLRAAREEADLLARLAEDLLLIARLDQGHLSVRREPIATAELLERIRARFARRAEHDGRRVTVEIDPAAGQLDADPVRLEQALANLTDNALRHGAGEIELHAARTGDRIELHVRDRGAGFPPEFLTRAFERFARGEESRTGAGAGLGLAIVEAIGQAHDGGAGVTNRPDGGADAWLWLPAPRSSS